MRSCSLALAAALAAGCSGGSAPDGTIALNELMAQNTTSLMDDAGAYPDWIELYNGGDETVTLAGLYLSDDPLDPDRVELSGALDIAGGGYLVLFADASLEPTDTHLAFALEKDGESLVLSAMVDDELVTLDEVSFGLQAEDVSYARTEDGTGEWAATETATPGETNG